MLVSLWAPSVHFSREADRRTRCRNNLHQLAIAFACYEDAHGVYPPGFTTNVARGQATAEVAWGTFVLPFIEEASLYRQYDFNRPAWDGANLTLSQRYIQQYECPSQGTGNKIVELGGKKLALTSYQPCWGSHPAKQQGLCGRNSSVSIRHIRDGASQTFCLAEVLSADKAGVPRRCDRPIPNFWAGAARKARCPVVWVGSGTQLPMNTILPGFRSAVFGSRHRGGAFFALCDGQVRFISENVDFTTYQALSTVRGAEVIDDRDY